MQQHQQQQEPKHRFASILGRSSLTKRNNKLPSRLLRSSFIEEIRKPPDPTETQIIEMEKSQYDELEAISILESSIFNINTDELLEESTELDDQQLKTAPSKPMEQVEEKRILKNSMKKKSENDALIEKFMTNDNTNEYMISNMPAIQNDEESLHSFISNANDPSIAHSEPILRQKYSDVKGSPMEDIVVIAASDRSITRASNRSAARPPPRNPSGSSSRSKIERARQKSLATINPGGRSSRSKHNHKSADNLHLESSNQSAAELSSSVSKFLSLPLTSSSSHMTEAPSTKNNGEQSSSESATDLKARIGVMEYQLQMLEQSCDVKDISLIPLKLQDLSDANENAKREQQRVLEQLNELTGSNRRILEELERARIEMQQSKSEAQNHIGSLEEQLTEVEAKCRHSEEDVMSMRNLESQLSQAMVGYKDRCKSLEDRITLVQEACQVNDISRLPDMLQQLYESRAHAQSKHIEAQQLLDLMKENNDRLLYELSIAREKINVLSELPNQIEQLEHDLDESQRAVKIHNEEICELKIRESQTIPKDEAMRQIESYEMMISQLQERLGLLGNQNQQLVNDLLVAREQTKQSSTKVQQLERDLVDTRRVAEQKNKEILALTSCSLQNSPALEAVAKTQNISSAEEQIEKIKVACAVTNLLAIPVIINQLKESLKTAESKNMESHQKLEEATAQNNLLQKELADNRESLSARSELPALMEQPEKIQDESQNMNLETHQELEPQRNSDTSTLRQIHDTPEITSNAIEEKIHKIEEACHVADISEIPEKIHKIKEACHVSDIDEIPVALENLHNSLRKLETLQMEVQQERDSVTVQNHTLMNELEEARAKVMALSGLSDKVKQLERDLEESQRSSQRGMRRRGFANDLDGELQSIGEKDEVCELNKALKDYESKCQEYDRQMKILSESCDVDDIAAVPEIISKLQSMLLTARTCQMTTQNDVAHLAKKNKFLIVELDSISAKHEEEKTEISNQAKEADEKLDDLNQKLVVIQEKCRVKHYDELPERIVFLERKLVEFYHEIQKSKAKEGLAASNVHTANTSVSNNEAGRNLDTSDRSTSTTKSSSESPKSHANMAAEVLLVKNELQVYKTKTEQARLVLFSLKDRCKVADVNDIPGKMNILEKKIIELTTHMKEQAKMIAQVEEYKKSIESSNVKVESLQDELKVTKSDLAMARDRIAFLSQEISKFPNDIDVQNERFERSMSVPNKADLRRAAFRLNGEPDLGRSSADFGRSSADLGRSSASLLGESSAPSSGRLDFTARLESFLMDNTPAFIDTGRLDSVQFDKRPSIHTHETELMEIERLKEALLESTTKVEDLEREIIELQMACKVRNVREIPSKLAAFEDDVAMMDEMYVQLETSEELVAELRQKLQETDEELESTFATVRELRNLLSETQSNVKRLNEEIAAKDATVVDLTEATRHVSSDLGKQNIRVVNLDRLAKDLTEKLKEAKKEREILHAQQLAELNKLRKDLEKRDVEVTQLKAELEEHTEELAEKSCFIDDLEDKHRTYSVKISELETILDVKQSGEMDEHPSNKSLDFKSLNESLQQLKLNVKGNRAQSLQVLPTEEIKENEVTLRRATEATTKLAASHKRVDHLTEELKKLRKSIPSLSGHNSLHSKAGLELDASPVQKSMPSLSGHNSLQLRGSELDATQVKNDSFAKISTQTPERDTLLGDQPLN